MLKLEKVITSDASWSVWVLLHSVDCLNSHDAPEGFLLGLQLTAVGFNDIISDPLQSVMECLARNTIIIIILYWNGQLGWTPALGLYLWGRDNVGMSTSRRNVELRNNVRLLLNVELRNYVISRQIVERRVTSDCYLNIVVSLDC